MTYCAVYMCQKQRPSYEMVLSVSKVLGNCSEKIMLSAPGVSAKR